VIDASTLGRLSLFADLPAAQLVALGEAMDEASYPRGTRILREGLSGNNFYVITEGATSVQLGGEERAQLRPGDFFGEISVLTGEPVATDVVAASEEVRCAVLPGPELRPLLLAYPTVSLRMLEVVARRLRDANLWAD
jgi:CRP-like cAMP-binding protein